MGIIADIKGKTKREGVNAAIDAYLGGEGKNLLGRDFTGKEREKFRNEIYDGTKGNATAGDVSKHINAYVDKIAPLESMLTASGLSVTAAQREKMINNFSADDLASVKGRASIELGRDATDAEVVTALQKQGFVNKPDLYAAHFQSIGQREQDIGRLGTLTGGSLTAEQKTELTGLSQSDFNAKYDDISRNFTPTEKYTGDAGRIIKDILGRDANQDELSHFGRGLASGSYDSRQLGDMIRQTQEFQDTSATKAREQLGQQAQGIDQAYLQKAAEMAQARFAGQGRGNSSAITAQFANASQELGRNRQNFLLGMGAQDVNQNRTRQYEQFLGQQANQQGQYDQANAYAQYLRQATSQQRTGYLQSSINTQLGQQNMALQNQYDIGNFRMQQSAYDQYMKQNRRQSLQNNMFGLVGAGVGAYGYGVGNNWGK